MMFCFKKILFSNLFLLSSIFAAIQDNLSTETTRKIEFALDSMERGRLRFSTDKTNNDLAFKALRILKRSINTQSNTIIFNGDIDIESDFITFVLTCVFGITITTPESNIDSRIFEECAIDCYESSISYLNLVRDDSEISLLTKIYNNTKSIFIEFDKDAKTQSFLEYLSKDISDFVYKSLYPDPD